MFCGRGERKKIQVRDVKNSNPRLKKKRGKKAKRDGKKKKVGHHFGCTGWRIGCDIFLREVVIERWEKHPNLGKQGSECLFLLTPRSACAVADGTVGFGGKTTKPEFQLCNRINGKSRLASEGKSSY